MTFEVTEDMIEAARLQLPGSWNRVRIRRALEAVFALLPEPVTEIPVTFPVAVHLVVDEPQLRAAVAAAAAQADAYLASAKIDGFNVATVRTEVPTGVAAGAESSPRGSIAAVAAHLGVARSTAASWPAKRAVNGMPEPDADGNYDLSAIEAWYRAWKAA